MFFTWDPRKARSNEKDHRVTFEEASSVFLDPDLHVEIDKGHPSRSNAIGRSAARPLVLFIVYECEGETTIRIISARLAEKAERVRRLVRIDAGRVAKAEALPSPRAARRAVRSVATGDAIARKRRMAPGRLSRGPAAPPPRFRSSEEE